MTTETEERSPVDPPTVFGVGVCFQDDYYACGMTHIEVVHLERAPADADAQRRNEELEVAENEARAKRGQPPRAMRPELDDIYVVEELPLLTSYSAVSDGGES